LPSEAKGEINVDRRDPGEEVEFDEEMDEESTSYTIFMMRSNSYDHALMDAY